MIRSPSSHHIFSPQFSLDCVEFFILKKKNFSAHIDFPEQPLNSLCAAVKITVLTAAFKVKNEVWTSAFWANVDEKGLWVFRKRTSELQQ